MKASTPPAPAPLDGVADATTSLGTGLGDFVRWIASVEGQAVLALGVAAAVAVALLLAKRLIGGALARGDIGDDSWRGIARDVVRRLMMLFVVMAGLRIGVSLVDAPEAVDAAVHLLFVIAAVLQGAIWAQAVAIHLLARFVARRGGADSSLASAVVLLRWLVMLIVWSIAFLLLLDNLGVNVTALVAGLGIGGVAIALAAQSTIANFFSAFQIITDRPFQSGDIIRFEGITATVEEIHLRTTRLRAVEGHEIIVPNSKLMEATIDNYHRMDERRTTVVVGIAYETAPDVVRAVPGVLASCVERVETARFARCHLSGFGPSSLDYELVFFARGADYVLLMDTRQEVLFNIFAAFAEQGIVIAYPTQTLYLSRIEGEAPEPGASADRQAAAVAA